MKQAGIIVICVLIRFSSSGQTTENTLLYIANQLESQAEKSDNPEAADALFELLAYRSAHPLNLNDADEDDLRTLLLLNDLQVSSFINYRRMLGKLISLYELQAVPAWNTAVISKLLPYVTVGENSSIGSRLRERYRGGKHQVLFRTAVVPELSAGYRLKADSSRAYPGGPESIYLRYKYNYKNLLQWGFLAKKDAGEQFFRGTQPYGFDYYTFHFFLRRSGIIKSLALGDFTVNMGQGLIQWQSLAFGKSDGITSIKRQSPVLQPYSAGSEYNFHRGIGITLQKGKWEGTGFVSLRKVSGNAVMDTLNRPAYVTSLLESGYHRTAGELQDKNNVRQLSVGGSFRYENNRWHIAANTVAFHFSMPLDKGAAPYNRYALHGSSFINGSFDYSYTSGNLHLFGESAIDGNGHTALIHGLILSAGPAADFSLVCRLLGKGYQSLYADAFTENTRPSNEKGIYAGIAIRPSETVTVNGYADVYSFPWLTYRADAPSYGKAYFVQVTYAPGKRVNFYTSFRTDQQQAGRSGSTFPLNPPEWIPRQNWRLQWSLAADRAITLRNRFEVVWYDKGSLREEGFLTFLDLLYKPPAKPFSGNLRLMYFETAGYNSRMYAFENDVMYAYSLPVFYDRGLRYYLNLECGLLSPARKHRLYLPVATCWLRVARTVYPGKSAVGSGNDEITEAHKTEVKLQLMVTF